MFFSTCDYVNGKKIKHIITILLLCAIIFINLCACGSKVESDDAFSDTFPKVYTCSFISLNEENTNKKEFNHKMMYDLNDFYINNVYYEAMHRIFKNTFDNTTLYEMTDICSNIDNLTTERLGHYHFIIIDLAEEMNFPNTELRYQTLVFDVELGDFWLGDNAEQLFVYGKCIDDNYNADSDLLAYVEGDWPTPKYDTFYEYLLSEDWMKESIK